MFKKRIWKPILIGLGWTTCLAGLVVLMSFIEVKKAEMTCKAIKVFIPGSQYFIDRQEIDNILEMSSHTLVGRKIERINIHDLENKLKANPFIEFAKVYADMDGVIHVEVSQRQPILRVMNRFDQDFYVDQHGLKMPLSQNFTARVLAANGFIDELFANKVDSLHTALARDIFKTADFIRKDSLWDAQIAQIYINEQHEIELIPRVGNQRILLGNADSLSAKFNNLMVFYKQALPMVGWDAYKLINIKYANQVVGVKNETLQDSLKSAAVHKARLADSVVHVSASPVKTQADSTAGNAVNEPKENEPVVMKPAKPVTENKPKVIKAAAPKKDYKPAAAKPAAKKTEKKTSIKQ
ncbi:cell division protein FtsQ/DivIB [Mucilaginibacter glaciei]|uniref:Cell division protein FtsQ n=1 Tax=Mucilaginibacter glaciei TaxID=2772109 RepID=A0A926S565_9SPHI|nr:cell division protein FtsQ [Mucilaginibacter glaciei]MBD1392456.1 cell division protein FtsQ [Mucilaginibacter glaciei]